MISLLPALLIALGGIALGAALGWLASVGVRDATGLPRPQAEVRMAALEAENLSLVSALSRARLQIEALETQLPAAEALGQQNMALQQTVADLRAVLAGVPLPEEGEARTLLAAARAERDAAQRALMRQVAEEAARKVMQDPPDRDRG
ncbi:MAG: hypothetical protein H6734_13495 [Alphaproteobacteria bacterium]|nr:hypothetical protein [Alphaproteobacteria bacterium]